jgi:hypothetical protein
MQFLKGLGIFVAIIVMACLALAIGVIGGFHLMWLILLWLVLSGLVGMAAKERERDSMQFFALAFLLSPIVSAAVLALLPNLREERLAQARHVELLDALLAVRSDYQANYR